jgi:ferredoxin--NADP+ reductase
MLRNKLRVFPSSRSITNQLVQLVQQVFEQAASNPRFRFFGNVSVGKDVTMEQLRGHYSAVVVATGAQRAKTLDIPGTDSVI